MAQGFFLMNELHANNASMSDVQCEMQEDQQEELEAARIERVQFFAQRISRLASEAVSKRAPLEVRWLSDLRQYEGQYSPATQQAIKDDPSRSGVFVNLTRRTVNSAVARVADMLFPTDDKNWGIKPTPVPELSKIREQAKQGMDNESVAQVDDVMKQAEDAAKAMENEMDDQLSEARMSEKAREALKESALYGTGILKGPVIVGKTRKAWLQKVDPATGEKVSILEVIEEHAPTVQHVTIWNYFPDPNATKIEECEYEMERHYMTRKQLITLAKSPAFFRSEIESLLRSPPSHGSTDNGRMSQMRAISGLGGTDYLNNRYEVWEYHGSVEREDLEALGVDVVDELDGYDCVVFVSGNRVIKAVINPMDSDEHPYSVLPWERDEAVVFGKGIPYLMRDSQSVVNAAWRTLMENMGLSSAPQIVVDKKAVTPANNDWRLTPRKIWFKNDQNVPINAAFSTFETSSHQAELTNLIDIASKLSDEETNMPRLMYGESAGASAQTMGGMAMQMNAANVVLRNTVKAFDDYMTRPMIRRFYHWNMQFNSKEEIKGDFNVKARGSSALLVKEQQAQSMMQFMQLTASPVFSALIDAPKVIQKVAQALHIEAASVLKTDEEIQQEQEQQAQQPPQDPALAKAQMDMQIAQMKLNAEQQQFQEKLKSDQQIEQMKMQIKQQELQTRQLEAQTKRETAIMKLSADRNLSIEQINGRLQEADMKHKADWKALIAEAEIKARFGSGI